MNKLFLSVALLGIVASCNKKKEFPDYEYQSVYFAYQYPVRTITLGEDVFNTDLDNQFKCKVFAATGGVYFSKKNVNISIAADNSLLGNGMLFSAGGTEIKPMPAKYYSLASNNIVIPEGELAGGVEVQLTQSFFDDPEAIKNTYVLPLKMTGLSNADTILANKNFVLYAIKYVNAWHGNYLRRGKDVITGSVNQTNTRHKEYVEYDDVNMLTTRSLSQTEFPVIYKDALGNNINVTLLLTFDTAGKCTVSSATANVTATGSGSFVVKGEKNSWGSKDRNALYLNYEINMPTMKVVSTDTLVARDRAVTMETFTPVNK